MSTLSLELYLLKVRLEAHFLFICKRKLFKVVFISQDKSIITQKIQSDHRADSDSIGFYLIYV